MSLNDSQKLDILWKKVNFGKAETDSIDKDGYNETIASPVPTYSKDVWNESEDIPVPPVLGLGQPFITDYESGYRCTEDFSVDGDKTWLATVIYGDPQSRQTDWIDSTFSPEYQIEVYDGDPINPASNRLYYNTPGEEWHFDYIAGVLHFPNNLPAVTEVWIRGYRYIGEKGVGGGTGGGSSNNWQVVDSTPFQATADDALLADTSLIPITITLPENPNLHDIVTIVPLYPTYDVRPVTVESFGGLLPIAGVMEDLVINQLGYAVQLSYIDPTIGWAVIKQGDVQLINQVDDTGVGIYIRLTEGEQAVPAYSAHTHSVAITDGQMADLIEGITSSVVVDSSFIVAHSHTVTVEYVGGRLTITDIADNHTDTAHTAEFVQFGELLPWKVVQSPATYAAITGDRILVDTQTNASIMTVELPADPLIGHSVEIAPLYPSYSLYPVTVDGNGNDINGSAADALLDQNGQSVVFTFIDGTIGWAVLNRGDTYFLTSVIYDYESELNWSVIDASGGTHAAIVFEQLLADSQTFGAFDIMLPESPSVGDFIKVAPVYPSYAANNVTIIRNTTSLEDINGAPSDLLLDQNGVSVELRFVGGTIGWVVFNRGETTVVNNVFFDDEFTWVVKDTDYTAVAFDRILADSQTNSPTPLIITLPATPNIGEYIKIAPMFPSYASDPVTVLRGSPTHTINGLLEDLLLSSDGISIELRYVGGSIGWAIINKGDTTVIQVVENSDALPNSMRAVMGTFTSADVGTFTIGDLLPNNARVVNARVFIEAGNEFNGGATLTLGSAGNPDAVAPLGIIDLTTADLDIAQTYFNVSTTDNQMQGTLGGTPTVGSAEVLIEYYIASN